jgi:hypothetical protein
MPLYIDHHKHVTGLTAEAVPDAHRKVSRFRTNTKPRH